MENINAALLFTQKNHVQSRRTICVILSHVEFISSPLYKAFLANITVKRLLIGVCEEVHFPSGGV